MHVGSDTVAAMRSLAVLFVAAAVEVAHADAPRSQLVGGLGVSVGRFYPGFHPDDRYYESDTFDGTLPWAYVGWRVRDDLAITVDAWVLRVDNTRRWSILAGGAAGVRTDWASPVQLTARVGYGHIEWAGNDSQSNYEAMVVGLDASIALLRDDFGAITVHARLMLHPTWHDGDHFDAPALLAIGLGVER